MNLEDIRQQFLDLGYFCPVYGETLFIGNHPVFTTTDPDIGSYKVFCTLKISGEKILIDHTKAQIKEESEFSNLDEVVDFVTSKFPINN